MILSSYTEKQKFSQAWLWILIIFSVLLTTVIFGAGIYIQMIKGRSFGNNPMSDTGLIISSCLIMAFNISGDKGLQLVFRNRKRLLIGTNRTEDLKQFLAAAKFSAGKYCQF